MFEPGEREDLVVDADQTLGLGGEVTTPFQTERLGAGGPVERLGHGRPPVDDDGVLFLIGNGEPTDVEPLARSRALLADAIDPPEQQRLAADLQPGQAVHGPVLDHVALESGLVGPTRAGFDGILEQTSGIAHRLQALVGPEQVSLLGGELGVLRHKPSFDRFRRRLDLAA